MQSAEMPSTRPGPGRALTLALVLFVLAAVIIYDRAILGALPGGPLSDTEHQGYPFLEYAAGMMRQGSFPHWNPLVFCGTPFFSSFSVPVFYPPRGVLLLLGGASAFSRLSFPIHLVLAGLFSWLFLGRLGLRTPGRLLGSFAFCCGAWANTLFYAGHGSKVVCWSYLPLLLYAVEGWMALGGRDGPEDTGTCRPGGWHRTRYLAIGGLAVGAQALASHPQIMMYSFGTAGLWGLLRLILVPGGRRLRRASVWVTGMVVILVIGALVGGVQLLPGMNFASGSARGEGLDLDRSASYSLPPEETLTMVFPHLFGYRHGFPESTIAGTPVYWGRLGLRLSSEFIGVSVFMLAIAGSLLSRRGVALPLLLVSLFGILVAWGGYTPLYGLLYRLVPLFSKLRAPHMAMFVPASLLPLLAGAGLDGVLDGDLFSGHRRKTFFVIGGAFVLLCLLAVPLAGSLLSGARNGPLAAVGERMDMARGDFLRAAVAGIVVIALVWGFRTSRRAAMLLPGGLILLAGLELVPIDRDFQYYLPCDDLSDAYPAARTDVLSSCTRVFPGENRLMMQGVASVQGYHAAKLSVTESFMTALRVPDVVSGLPVIRQSAADCFLLDGQAVRYTRLRDEIENYLRSSLDTAASAGIDSAQVEAILERIPPDPLPRFFLAESWERVGPDRAREWMSLGYDQSESTLLLERPPGLSARPGSAGEIELISEGPDRLTLMVRRPGEEAGLLVIADTWYDRWRATVDGRPTQILRANYWQRALVVPPSASGALVEIWYDGSEVLHGLLLTIAGLIASAALLLFGRKRRPDQSTGVD